MSNRGFLLVDSLICIFIVMFISTLIMNTFVLEEKFQEGYDVYQERISLNYQSIYSQMEECEKCVVIKEDLLNYDS